MIALAYILSGLSLLICVLFLIKPKASVGFIMVWFPLTAGALSPYWAVMGAVGAVIGLVYQALWAVPMGIVGAGMMIWYIGDALGITRVLKMPLATAGQTKYCLSKPGLWSKSTGHGFFRMKASPEPSWERDIPFWTIPDTDRQLLCDIWCPADGNVSGLAFVYLHGSGWAVLDKDFGTRPFFRQLTAQGHTVMDVAYRLIPEVDIYGMVGDAKRAVAWIKANADCYGVNPDRIVLGGGSAGAHIALLAGYTPKYPELTPEDAKGADLSVCGIISYYGPTDLVVAYKHYDLKRQPPVPIGTIVDPKMAFSCAGRLDILLGGYPEDVPDMYQLACPTTHVHPSSPPTLLMQGIKDFLFPLEGTQVLYTKLVESGVPAINLVFPWTDHGFDLLLPQISPPAQSALYNVDRFLALMVNRN